MLIDWLRISRNYQASCSATHEAWITFKLSLHMRLRDENIYHRENIVVSTKRIALLACIGIALAGCNKQTEVAVDATCLSPETQAKIKTELLGKVERELRDSKYDDGRYMYDEAKIRATLTQTNIAIEKVITTRDDPDSSKKFCKGNLVISVPPAMFDEIKESERLAVELSIEPVSYRSISQFAREKGFSTSANTFTKEGFQYSTQPTDDKKEVSIELEESTVKPLAYRVAEMVLLKPLLETEKAERSSQLIEEKSQELKRQQENDRIRKETENTYLEIEKKKLEQEKLRAEEKLKKSSEPFSSKTSNDAMTRVAFSEKLGVEVFATGEQWCQQSVNLTIKLDSLSPLINTQELEGFIPKLKAPIENDCPRAAIAILRAVDSKGELIGKYKSYKSNDWIPEIFD